MKLLPFFVFFIPFAVVGTPSDSENEVSPSKKPKLNDVPAGTTSSSSSSVTTSSTPCFFANERKSPFETIERDYYTKVSTDCGGTLMRWKEVIGQFTGDFHGARDEMDLLAARGAAEYADFEDAGKVAELENRLVCTNHLKELITSWTTRHHHIRKVEQSLVSTTRNRFKCGMHPSISEHRTEIPTTPGGSYLTRDEAKRLLEEQNVHVHIGTPLCLVHKSSVSISQCASQLESSVKIDEPITSRLRSVVKKHEDSSTCSLDYQMDTSEHQGTAAPPAALPDIDPSKVDVCKSKFYEWAESTGIKFLTSRKQFSALSRRSKQRKADATIQLYEYSLHFVAPGHTDELRRMSRSEEIDQWPKARAEFFEKIMKNIVEDYHNASTRKERRGLLSLVAGTLPYSIILKYFPTISRYEYTKARMHSALLNRKPYASTRRERFTREYVIEFVDFMTSPIIRTDLPYGRKTLKKSDGSKIIVADTLRNVRAIEIIEMYIKYKTDRNEKNQLMSRSTYFKILESCKATTREALECVDYFVSDALDSFEKLFGHLKTMSSSNYIDDVSFKSFDRRLRDAKLYLQTDYKLHLKLESKISDHCTKFALSDPHDKAYQENCKAHDHKSYQCERCQAIRNVFEDLLESVGELIESAQKKTLKRTADDNIKAESSLVIIRNDIKIAEKNVLELKKHLVRNKHSIEVRQNIVDNLASDEAFLTLDWAQKVLPRKATESQSDYFGKSGISVHCIHVLSIDGSGQLRQHSFIHITQHESQDSLTVLLILENALVELKKAGIQHVHLRSDNAGCYHSAKTITSLPDISKRTGVNIKSFTFSEAQGGKGAADRTASEMKRKLRTWLGSGKNAETPAEIFAALTEGRVPTAMSTYLCSVDYTSAQQGTTVVDGIQNIYDFRYNETSEEMTMRKFGFIGVGKTLSSKSFVPSKGSLKIEKSGGFLPSNMASFWKSSTCKKRCSEENNEVSDEFSPFDDDDVDVDEPNPKPMETVVFQCPEEQCDATFLKYGNLENHLALGKHKIRPERETLYDTALGHFAENLEGVNKGQISTTLQDVFKELPAGSLDFVAGEGWALPEKRTNKRYNKEAVEFVYQKFTETVEKSKKIFPKLIEQELREARKADGALQFLPEDCLNYKQILNLYRAFGKKKREVESRKKSLEEDNKENSSAVQSTTVSTTAAPSRRSNTRGDRVEGIRTTTVPTTTASSRSKGIRTTTAPTTTVPSRRFNNRGGRVEGSQSTTASTTAAPSTKYNTRGSRADASRSKREVEDVVVEEVMKELQEQEYDDSEDVYDNNADENSDFDALMQQIERDQKNIFSD